MSAVIISFLASKSWTHFLHGTEYNAPPGTIWVISGAVSTANHSARKCTN